MNVEEGNTTEGTGGDVYNTEKDGEDMTTLIFDIYKIPTEGMSQEAYDRMQDRGNGVNAALYAPEGTKPLARVAVTQSKRLESVADMAHSAAFEYASIDQFETQTCSRLSPDQASDSDMGVDLSL